MVGQSESRSPGEGLLGRKAEKKVVGQNESRFLGEGLLAEED